MAIIYFVDFKNRELISKQDDQNITQEMIDQQTADIEAAIRELNDPALIRVIQVENCSYEGLYTMDAYEELRLLMSTGDFHAHRAKSVLTNHLSAVITLNDLIGA